ncbi:MAG: hypothetical protein ACMUEM_00520 [Flavobacteriales bacterium AspAUS03]
MDDGVTCTTILLLLGIPIPSISSCIHITEIFLIDFLDYIHYKLTNVNKKLFKILLVPGVLVFILGDVLLSRFGET